MVAELKTHKTQERQADIVVRQRVL